MSVDEDPQRITAGLLYGYVKNDYDDCLGTGFPLKSNTELRSFVARCMYRFHGNWFARLQGVYQNFAVGGETAADDEVIDAFGVRPYKSGGLGLMIFYDMRDNKNMPMQGWVVNVSRASRGRNGQRCRRRAQRRRGAQTSRAHAPVRDREQLRHLRKNLDRAGPSKLSAAPDAPIARHGSADPNAPGQAHGEPNCFSFHRRPARCGAFFGGRRARESP